MTIDEAIKHAEEVAEDNENNAQIWHKQTKNRIVDFCDKAIQAETNCIKCAEEHRQLAEWLKDYKRLLKQEPKTGYWYIDERPESNRETICSNCEQPILKYHKLDFDYRPKFCPNCGADMRGEQNG